MLLTLKGKQANLPSGGVLDRLGCARCESRGYGCLPDYPPLKKYKEVAVDRPLAKEEFDQWFMTPEHALHRIGFIHARGDLLNKRILIIGDDDLVGVAAAITGNTPFLLTSDSNERHTHSLRISPPPQPACVISIHHSPSPHRSTRRSGSTGSG